MTNRITGDFRKYMDKSFLGAWDVPKDGDLTLTIDHCEVNEVKNERGTERKLTLHFIEDFKPMILNTTNSNTISDVYGSRQVEDWEGKKISLYTEKVRAFGGTTDALRIRPYRPESTELICEECGKQIVDVAIDGKTYRAKVIAENAKTKFGRYLCYECAQKAKGAE
jgi:hypothetical protein